MATHMTEQALRLSGHIVRLENGKVTHGEVSNVFEGNVDIVNSVPAVILNDRVRVQCAEPPGADGTRAGICISASEIVLSLQPLASSMRNSFSGTVTALRQTAGPVEVTVDIGISLQALITAESLETLSLSIGSPVCVSFKATSVKIL